MKNLKQTPLFSCLSQMVILMLFIVNVTLLFAQTKLPNPPELIPYRKGDKWGYCDRNKKIVIECKYDEVEKFHNGVAEVKVNNEKFFINTKGEKVEAPIEKIEQEVEEEVLLKAFEENGLYGYKDKAGNIVIKPKYQYAMDFSDGLAAVKLNNRWGYIDIEGNLVIQLKYDDAWMFEDGLAVVGIDGYVGYIDAKGNEYWEDFKSSKVDNSSWLKSGTKLNYTIDYIDPMSFELREISDKIHYSWYKGDKKGGEIIISNEALKNSLNQYNYIYRPQSSNEPLILTDGTSVFCSQKMFNELKKRKKVTFYPYTGKASTPVELFLKGQKKVNVKYKDTIIALDCIACESPTGERLVILNNSKYPLIVHMILNFKIHLKHIE